MGIVEERDEIVAALRSYPMEPLPDGFKTGVMRRVRGLRQPELETAGFRFPWADLAGSLVVAFMGGLGVIIWQITRTDILLSPGPPGRMQAQLLLAEQWLRLSLPWPVLWMVIGGALMALGMLFTTWRMFGRNSRT